MNKAKARRNISIYRLLSVLRKRLYLPVIAIFYVDVVGLSLEQIGILGAVYAATRILAEVPSGYMSDRFSRKYTLVIAGVVGTVSQIIRVTNLSMSGAVITAVLESVSYAFLSGTHQAVLHDSLEKLGKLGEYARTSSRTQSQSLLVNTGLMALAPMTYAIDPRMPFVLGSIQFLFMAVSSGMITDFKSAHHSTVAIEVPSAKGLNYIKKHRSFIVYALAAGLFGATYLSTSSFEDLMVIVSGIPPSKTGWIYASGSLVGAGLGWWIHHLEKMDIRKYAAMDVLIATGSTALFTTANPFLVTIAFIFSMSFWRYRGIIYDQRILAAYKTKQKATLISVAQNVEQLATAAQAALLGVLIGAVGLATGLLIASGIIFFFGAAFVLTVSVTLAKRVKS